jgi:four helix bundle protein
MPDEAVFAHERMEVYRLALDFVTWASEVAPLRDRFEILDEPSRALMAWIAEGSAKRMGEERLRFFDLARGAAMECAAGLDVLVARGFAEEEEMRPGKVLLARVVALWVQLMRVHGSCAHEDLDN